LALESRDGFLFTPRLALPACPDGRVPFARADSVCFGPYGEQFRHGGPQEKNIAVTA